MSKRKQYPAADRSKQQQPPKSKRGSGDTAEPKATKPAELVKNVEEEDSEA
jgi:hypothetical protein